jgi:hypothetical protein
MSTLVSSGQNKAKLISMYDQKDNCGKSTFNIFAKNKHFFVKSTRVVSHWFSDPS